MHLPDEPVTTKHQAPVISLPMSPPSRFLRIVDSKCWLDKCTLCHALIETVTAAHRQVRRGTDGRSRELCLQGGGLALSTEEYVDLMTTALPGFRVEAPLQCRISLQ